MKKRKSKKRRGQDPGPFVYLIEENNVVKSKSKKGLKVDEVKITF
jgi:hypothetical protein